MTLYRRYPDDVHRRAEAYVAAAPTREDRTARKALVLGMFYGCGGSPMLTFPTITNEKVVRFAHPERWRMLVTLKRQAGVQDRQIRKLNLTTLVARWKGVGMPPPVLTDPPADSWLALRRASQTLEPADILAAYRSCAAYVGAELEG